MTGEKGAQLGPVIRTQVELEGHPTEALLDTGSPVTIASLEYVIKVLLEQKPEGQTQNGWEEKPPDITLQNYGGDKINVVGQMTLKNAGELIIMKLISKSKGMAHTLF